MTNEEASNILDDFDVNFEGHTAEEVAEAFDVAFRALEQETCEDCISREDALMALTGDITDCTVEEYIARLRDRLSKLPSVTPKKTETWNGIHTQITVPKDTLEQIFNDADDDNDI